MSACSFQLIPQPSEVELETAFADFRNAVCVSSVADAEWVVTELEVMFQVEADRFGGGVIELRRDYTLDQEAYTFTVRDGLLEIRAADTAGYVYALQTLKQLAFQSPAGLLPVGRVVDRPAYRWRGFMLDSVRNFQPLPRIKACLDWLCLIKINHFHWHLIDSQGWRIAIDRYPELTRIGSVRGAGDEVESGFYSQDEIREVIAYAALRNITVIPEVEMPAHSDALTYCHPELSCRGTPRAFSDIPQAQYHMDGDRNDVRNLCAGNDAVFELLGHVLEEVAALFPGPYIHIGGDERNPNLWNECPRCRERMRQEGLEDEIALQLYFMNRVARQVLALGKTPIMWAENPERGIPDGVIVQGWRGRETRIAAAARHPVICSDNPYFYMDYFEYPHLQGVEWLLPMDLRKVYEYDPETVLDAAELPYLLGSEAPLWTSWIWEDEIDFYMFPRMLAVAENTWHPAPRDFEAFSARVAGLEAFFARAGIRYAKPLNERPFPTICVGATVTTDIPHREGFPPAKALTPSRYTYSWSSEAPRAGMSFLVTFPVPQRVRRLVLRFGKTDQSYGVPLGARLALSADGVDFAEAATVAKRRVEVPVDARGLKAFRLVFPQDLEQELIVREIVLT